MVLEILLQLSERLLLRYTIARCALCLSAANMVNSPKECFQRFTILADRLFVLKKISASVVDNSKYQFKQFLNIPQYECKEEFLKFCFKKDCQDVFFAPFLAENDSRNHVWAICKISLILSHGQSFTERRFSINREVIDIICRENSWYRKGLCIMQFIILVLSFLIFKLHLIWGKAVCFLTKGTNRNWKKMWKKKETTVQIWNTK